MREKVKPDQRVVLVGRQTTHDARHQVVDHVVHPNVLSSRNVVDDLFLVVARANKYYTVRWRAYGWGMHLQQRTMVNSLLRSMPPADFALLAGRFSRIEFPVRLQLHEAGRKIEHVYFPEDGLVSIVAVRLDGTSSEVGLFGQEGMSETATVLGTDYSPHEAYVQIAGTSALKLPVDRLNEAMETSATLRRHLLHYVQAMMVQLSSSIAAGGNTIEQRLARWLLMCHDRMEGDIVYVTHDFLSMMLAVRRAGVTVALGKLEERKLIAKARNSIRILDRSALQKSTGGGYGLAESEYERLIGTTLSKDNRPKIAA